MSEQEPKIEQEEASGLTLEEKQELEEKKKSIEALKKGEYLKINERFYVYKTCPEEKTRKNILEEIEKTFGKPPTWPKDVRVALTTPEDVAAAILNLLNFDSEEKIKKENRQKVEKATKIITHDILGGIMAVYNPPAWFFEEVKKWTG